MNSWNIRNAWDAAVAGDNTPLMPRDYLYASELGGSDIDIILKMRGTPPTNPPNARSRRKFFAGNVFEDILYLALLRCGVVLDSQVRGQFQYDGLLRVSGRCDMICGGSINREKCEQEIKSMKLSEHMEELSLSVLYNLSDQYGSMLLKPMVIECKSVSDFMFSRHEKNQEPASNHLIQCFHYLKSMHMDEGRVIYINKDDCRLLEFTVYNSPETEEKYKAEISRLTHLYQSGALPAKEPELIFDGRITKNWKVEYSNYLTMLYGYNEPHEYAEKWKGSIARWNRVIGRIKSGKKMTDENKKAIDEIHEHFTNFTEIIEKAEITEETLN